MTQSYHYHLHACIYKTFGRDSRPREFYVDLKFLLAGRVPFLRNLSTWTNVTSGVAGIGLKHLSDALLQKVRNPKKAFGRQKKTGEGGYGPIIIALIAVVATKKPKACHSV